MAAIGGTRGSDAEPRPRELVTESRRFFPAYHSSGRRDASDLHVIVVHATESTGSASSVAAYFQSPASGGSAQVVCGDDGVYCCLDDLTIPWGAPPLNTNGLHVEQVGMAEWSQAEWLSHPKTIDACADVVAGWCKSYRIPTVWLTAADLQAGKRGVTSHANVSAAFHKTDHTDPGAGYPVSTLLSLVTTRAKPVQPVSHADKWTWLAWWLGEGAFKKYGPHQPQHRPAGLPARIPAAWWAFARAFLARRRKK